MLGHHYMRCKTGSTGVKARPDQMRQSEGPARMCDRSECLSTAKPRQKTWTRHCRLRCAAGPEARANCLQFRNTALPGLSLCLKRSPLDPPASLHQASAGLLGRRGKVEPSLTVDGAFFTVVSTVGYICIYIYIMVVPTMKANDSLT